MIIHCGGCATKVGDIKTGSMLKTGIVHLCAECETKRKALELMHISKPKSKTDDIQSSFANIFKNDDGTSMFDGIFGKGDK